MAKKSRTPRWLHAARTAGESPERKKLDWVSRALARAGVLPLAEAEAAVKAGRVKVANRTVKEPFSPVGPGETVHLDGRVVDVAPRTLVLVMHKPKGVVTAGTDAEGHGTVFDVLKRALPKALEGFGWHAVGRLDRDTTGLLLFTNDERFVSHATSPETHLPKRYVATVGADVTEAKLNVLRKGIVLDDGPARPAKATARGPREVELVLTEGRWHQVKRMLGGVGLPVLSLHREAVGALLLDVEEGALRQLSDDEVQGLLGFSPRGAV